jgi:hypothetical protein
MLAARRLHDDWRESRHGEWCDLAFQLRRELFVHMTTEAMAAYLLGELAK